jgi:hypothetical protein
MRAVPLFLLALCACGAPAASSEDRDFIALASDFDGFATDWPKADLGHHAADGLHLAGTRTIYLSRRPPNGATAFPVGTRVVKTVRGDDGGLQVFAMAKRGGDYNSEGARGWEWFELTRIDGPPVINWRGTNPPASSAYGGSAMTCNGCHASAAANDSVLTPELQLESL